LRGPVPAGSHHRSWMSPSFIPTLRPWTYGASASNIIFPRVDLAIWRIVHESPLTGTPLRLNRLFELLSLSRSACLLGEWLYLEKKLQRLGMNLQ
jgi:hypothetical protein